MDLNLKGKVAIVTGAGRGIGRTIALTLGREGADVVIDDIDLDVAQEVVREVKELGVQSMAIKADVTKPDEVKRMIEETFDKFGTIDILINNAGILYVDGKPVMLKAFEETNTDEWPGFINITLYGVLNCCKAVLGPMLSKNKGSIVNIVSDAARAPRGTRTSIYGAGKAGIIGFSRNLALEGGPSGIRVNCVSPGTVRGSRMKSIEEGKETRPEVLKFWEDIKSAEKRMPLRRIADPQEIANVVVFLASDAASYVTGQTLSVNAGLFMA